MELGVLKKAALAAIGGVLLVGRAVPAKAQEAVFPLIYGEAPGEDSLVIELREGEGEYTVQPGDSLWGIAQNLWGEGSSYGELFDANREIISSPGMIYPGMHLKTARTVYIGREKASQGGVQMGGEYSLDLPYGWAVGTVSSGDAFANFVLSGIGVKSVACLIQDKKRETEEELAFWEQCRQKIQDFGEKRYGDSVSDFAFSHYVMGDGDEVYLYAYTYRIGWENSGSSTEVPVRVCVGMKLTESIQAEFVGYAVDYDIEGCVRYIAASFLEDPDYKSRESGSVNDSNMSITPAEEWEVEGLFNSFAWVEEFFTSLMGKITGEAAKEPSPRQSLMDRMSRKV